jgi:hypothetical protein
MVSSREVAGTYIFIDVVHGAQGMSPELSRGCFSSITVTTDQPESIKI